MANMNEFQLQSVYDFTTHAPSVLGDFKKVKVVAFGDWNIAQTYIDVAAMHVNVYGTLPAGTINDYKSYSYIIIVLQNGERTALGLPWIDSASIQLFERNTIYATIEDVGPDDVDKIKRVLSSNGYGNVTLRID
tara:strand:- start:8860 stop:9261 length:402 start_codon:yes stop_codon:yes gene_type:complete